MSDVLQKVRSKGRHALIEMGLTDREPSMVQRFARDLAKVIRQRPASSAPK